MAPHFLLSRPFLSRCSCGGVFCAVRWEITGRLTEVGGPCPFEGVRRERQACFLALLTLMLPRSVGGPSVAPEPLTQHPLGGGE